MTIPVGATHTFVHGITTYYLKEEEGHVMIQYDTRQWVQWLLGNIADNERIAMYYAVEIPLEEIMDSFLESYNAAKPKFNGRYIGVEPWR